MKIILFIIGVMGFSACNRDKDKDIVFSEKDVTVSPSHSLKTFVYQCETNNYVAVFEQGLGDDHTVWQEKKVALQIAARCDVILYDRAGYGQSTIDTSRRNIDRLRRELETVILAHAGSKPVILVGHSLGGLVIRDYAIKSSSKVAALLFVDPSHEDYNQPDQLQEDQVFDAFFAAYGENFGGTKEARELIEDMAYIALQGSLPNVPTCVLTSMKSDAGNNSADAMNNKTRQDWYNAHETLKLGLTDFTHVQTLQSGHYIMREEPSLVISCFNELFSRLP